MVCSWTSTRIMDEMFFVWIEKRREALEIALHLDEKKGEREREREAGLSRERPGALVFPQRHHSAKPGFRLQV